MSDLPPGATGWDDPRALGLSPGLFAAWGLPAPEWTQHSLCAHAHPSDALGVLLAVSSLLPAPAVSSAIP